MFRRSGLEQAISLKWTYHGEIVGLVENNSSAIVRELDTKPMAGNLTIPFCAIFIL